MLHSVRAKTDKQLKLYEKAMQVVKLTLDQKEEEIKSAEKAWSVEKKALSFTTLEKYTRVNCIKFSTPIVSHNLGKF